MEETQSVQLDRAAFQRVWRRVMPEDRPDCPFTLDPPTPAPPAAPLPVQAPSALRTPPAQAPVCLGEASAAALPELERLTAAAVDGERIYRALARRWRREPLLPELARSKRRQAGRLAAACFLISGTRFSPPPTPAPAREELPLALRTRFQAEQRLALQLLSASGAVADPCLIELYRELARQCQSCAGRIRAWMEQK